MKAEQVKEIFAQISAVMTENRDYLIELDQQNGDGDLGISMSEGYEAVVHYLESAEEKDLGKLFMGCARTFNEAAPSSLGTITSFGLMGMAKALKGKEEAPFAEAAQAMEKGLENIMAKGGAKPGEKTIIDALDPGIRTLLEYAGDPDQAVKKAAEAAAEGSEATRAMHSVHGRAAYYGDKSIGVLDGGSVVGKLIFEGISRYWNAR